MRLAYFVPGFKDQSIDVEKTRAYVLIDLFLVSKATQSNGFTTYLRARLGHVGLFWRIRPPFPGNGQFSPCWQKWTNPFLEYAWPKTLMQQGWDLSVWSLKSHHFALASCLTHQISAATQYQLLHSKTMIFCIFYTAQRNANLYLGVKVDFSAESGQRNYLFSVNVPQRTSATPHDHLHWSLIRRYDLSPSSD